MSKLWEKMTDLIVNFDESFIAFIISYGKISGLTRQELLNFTDYKKLVCYMITVNLVEIFDLTVNEITGKGKIIQNSAKME